MQLQLLQMKPSVWSYCFKSVATDHSFCAPCPIYLNIRIASQRNFEQAQSESVHCIISLYLCHFSQVIFITQEFNNQEEFLFYKLLMSEHHGSYENELAPEQFCANICPFKDPL